MVDKSILCQDLRERAKRYIEVMYFGVTYLIPITDKLHKVLKSKDDYDIEKALQDVIASVYLQIRDTVGRDIKRQLGTQIEQGFGRIFQDKVDKAVDAGFKSLEYKPSKK